MYAEISACRFVFLFINKRLTSTRKQFQISNWNSIRSSILPIFYRIEHLIRLVAEYKTTFRTKKTISIPLSPIQHRNSKLRTWWIRAIDYSYIIVPTFPNVCQTVEWKKKMSKEGRGTKKRGGLPPLRVYPGYSSSPVSRMSTLVVFLPRS